MKQEELNKILEDHKLWLYTRFDDEVKGKRANFEGAYLRGVDFRRAKLEGSNFEGAYLRGVDFRRAKLERVTFRGVTFDEVDLRGAYLEGAYLGGANFFRSNFREANFFMTNFRGANFDEVDLRGIENIPESLISYFKKDLRYVLTYTKPEIPYLKERLEKGEVDGTQYEGECACLIGSLANSKKERYEEFISCIPDYELGSHNPSEQLFYQIRKGDTPENNQFAKIAMEVIEEFN